MDKITMFVTAEKVGYCYLRTCGDPDPEKQTNLCLVPTYKMELKWTKNNKAYTCEYEVVRYGVIYDKATKKPKVDEKFRKKYGPSDIVTWCENPTSNPHAEKGAWQIEDNYTVDDGPGSDSIDGESKNDTFSYAFAA